MVLWNISWFFEWNKWHNVTILYLNTYVLGYIYIEVKNHCYNIIHTWKSPTHPLPLKPPKITTEITKIANHHNSSRMSFIKQQYNTTKGPKIRSKANKNHQDKTFSEWIWKGGISKTDKKYFWRNKCKKKAEWLMHLYDLWLYN